MPTGMRMRSRSVTSSHRSSLPVAKIVPLISSALEVIQISVRTGKGPPTATVPGQVAGAGNRW
jgi:hypothetical protein